MHGVEEVLAPHASNTGVARQLHYVSPVNYAGMAISDQTTVYSTSGLEPEAVIP